MKKQVKVIRTANQTVVIYRDPPKGKAPIAVMKQRPVPVYQNGRKLYYISLPSGRCTPVRRGFMWRIIKFIRPSVGYATV